MLVSGGKKEEQLQLAGFFSVHRGLGGEKPHGSQRGFSSSGEGRGRP